MLENDSLGREYEHDLKHRRGTLSKMYSLLKTSAWQGSNECSPNEGHQTGRLRFRSLINGLSPSLLLKIPSEGFPSSNLGNWQDPANSTSNRCSSNATLVSTAIFDTDERVSI